MVMTSVIRASRRLYLGELVQTLNARMEGGRSKGSKGTGYKFVRNVPNSEVTQAT